MLRVDDGRLDAREEPAVAASESEVAPVEVAAYETWRASRDIDEVIFRFEAAHGEVPEALYRLRRFVRAIVERRQGVD